MTEVEEPQDGRVETTWMTLVRRIWRAVQQNRGLVALTLLAGMARAFFEKVPFLLFQPFFRVVDPAQSGPATPPKASAAPSLGQWVQDQVEQVFRSFSAWLASVVPFVDSSGPNADKVVSITGITGLIVIFGVLGGVMIYGVTVLSRYFAMKIVVDLRNEVAAHILQLPLRFFARQRMGQLISHLTADTAVLSRSLTMVSDHSVTDPVLVLFNFVLIVIYVPQLWWVFVLMVPLMALPMLRAGKKVRRSSSKSLAAMGDATESLNQILSGIKTVKAFQMEQRRQQEFADNNARFLHRTKRMLQAKGLAQGSIFVIYNLGLALMLALLTWWIVQGVYQPHQVLIAAGALGTTYTPLKRLCRAYNTLAESLGALGGIEAILQTRPDVSARDAGVDLDGVRGEVEMRNVTFAYDDKKGPVLRDVSFKAAPGMTVALVGASGAGKSTAVDLLARFYDPTGGQVLVDGHDLRDVRLGSYRQHVAMVSQQPFLFNSSIFDNIECGRPGATSTDVEAAATQAQIHDFVIGLPSGYDTIVGERGSNLSGGQMQRITIARAILRDPKVLFLDEATSALDSEIEEAVQVALENLMRGRTSFVIAHRLATIRSADQILVFEAGCIIERGDHDALLAQGGVYARMCGLQGIAAG